MRHVVIKVGTTHNGALPPGLLVLIPVDKVRPLECGVVSFENPGGGYSFGEAVGFFDMTGG